MRARDAVAVAIRGSSVRARAIGHPSPRSLSSSSKWRDVQQKMDG